jgi:hypothetical protein
MALQIKKPKLQMSVDSVESAAPSFAAASVDGLANYMLDGILAILTLVLLGATLVFQILEVVHR